VVNADNSWLSQPLNRSRDLASYGLLQAEAVREQLAQCGKKVSDNSWVLQHRNQSRDLANYGFLVAEAFREHLTQCGKKISDNSWVSQHRNQSRDLANNGLLRAEAFRKQLARGMKINNSWVFQHQKQSRLRAEAFRDQLACGMKINTSWMSQHRKQSQLRVEAFRNQLAQCGKKISKGKRRFPWMMMSNSKRAAEGIELQRIKREVDAEQHEGTLSQMNADQQDSRVPAAGAQVKEAEPKLFDMTVNDYDDYETDFFPASSAKTTDASMSFHELVL